MNNYTGQISCVIFKTGDVYSLMYMLASVYFITVVYYHHHNKCFRLVMTKL